MKCLKQDFIKENIDISKYTTFKIGGKAQYFCEIKSDVELEKAINFAEQENLEIFLLGEGSNLLVSDLGIKGLVVKFYTNDIVLIDRSNGKVKVKVSAGVQWDDLVKYTVKNGYWGIENMSLIPGTVGACPVQNVGAYGQDCRQVVTKVYAYDLIDRRDVTFSNSDCKFGFRSSIFNKTRNIRYIIKSVEFEFSTSPAPNLSRPELKRLVESISEGDNLQDKIRNSVITLRTNGVNLPNLPNYGCAGTFFRTAIVPVSSLPKIVFLTFLNLGPKMALLLIAFSWKYRSSDGIKLPSKLLINSCGLKDVSEGDLFLYSSNPAVLVSNIEKAPTANDAIKVICKVRKIVYKKTSIKIPIEPTLVGFDENELNVIFN